MVQTASERRNSDIKDVSALSDVTVIEIGQAISGPYATQLLADMGARVIKVEKITGDDSRTLPPHFVGDSSAYFMACNRSKESLAIDLKSEFGRQVLLALVSRAQIVLENNRPGVLDRLGVGFDRLREANPKIVLCSITGFGQDGPYRDDPAYDMIVQAMSGGVSITGAPDGKPIRSGLALGDVAAGMMAAFSAVSALRLAERTGDAQHVDVSMLDVQVSMLTYKMVYYLLSGVEPRPEGFNHSGIAEMGAFTCADGVDVLLAPLAENMWPSVCAALDRNDLLDDPRYRNRIERGLHRQEIRAELERTFKTRRSSHWMAQLRTHKVPAATVDTLSRVVANPQIQHRKMVVDSSYGDIALRLIGNPVRIRNGGQRYEPPPHLGENTLSILHELEIAEEAIDQARRNGLIRCFGA